MDKAGQTLSIYVGIDVAKDHLDVAYGVKDKPDHVEYTAEGLKILVERLKAIQPKLVVLEATGGLEVRLMAELCAGNIPVARVNPKRVREFAKATGRFAKTDQLWMLGTCRSTEKLFSRWPPRYQASRSRS